MKTLTRISRINLLLLFCVFVMAFTCGCFCFRLVCRLDSLNIKFASEVRWKLRECIACVCGACFVCLLIRIHNAAFQTACTMPQHIIATMCFGFCYDARAFSAYRSGHWVLRYYFVIRLMKPKRYLCTHTHPFI